jgi:ubiquinone/menaquinone biosynthesis C-methylase UbiE
MRVEKERLDTTGFMPIWLRHEHLARFQFAAKFVSGREVIDCACGDGTGTAIFAKAGPKSLQAFDLSPETITACQTRYPDLQQVRFAVGDATKLPLADASADLFISLETIEHLPDDLAYLREVHRVLRHDGIFICSTPDRLTTNPGITINDRPVNIFHLREYSRAEFGELLGQFFESIEWFGQNRQSGLWTKITTWLGRNISPRLTFRFNQVLKLPRFLYDRLPDHAVKSAEIGCWEYQLAVCRRPKSSRSQG